MSMISQAWRNRRVLRSIIKTIYFNFHYLPFKQAVKLPVLLYKPKFVKLKGTVAITAPAIRTGMIRLGFRNVSIYPGTGITWENTGNVIFEGRCNIGNASAISISNTGRLVFGDNFRNSANIKIVCYHSIVFSHDVRTTWELLVMDTNMHGIKDMEGNRFGKGYAPIVLGCNNWIGTRSLVLSGARTPDYCIVAAGSIVKKDYSRYPSHIMMAGNPLEIKKEGVWRDMHDDELVYE